MLKSEEQRPVEVRRSTWYERRPSDPDGSRLLDEALDLADERLGRDTIRDAIQRDVLLAIPLAAMWGTGFRVRGMAKFVGQALETPDQSRDALMRMVEGIQRGPREAFSALWDPTDTKKAAVKGFGTSFGTKLLAFLDAVAERPEDVDAPLIYDLMVCRTLAAIGASWPDSIPCPGPRTFDPPTGCVRFDNYAAWCRLAAELAELERCTPTDVEYTFFTFGRTLGPSVRLPRSGCGKLASGEAPEGDLGLEVEAIDSTEQPDDEAIERLRELVRRL